MLSRDAAVEAVIFGDGGALSALPHNAIHISMSTISVALSDRLAEAHGKAGQGYAAAPVFGRPEAAATAKLFIIAAGTERHSPLPAAVRCDGPADLCHRRQTPDANLVKLTGNFLIASVLELLGEAFALVRKPASIRTVSRHPDKTLFSAPVYRDLRRQHRRAAESRQRVQDIARVEGYAAGARRRRRRAVPMPVASLVRDHLVEAVAQGEGDADWSGLARIAARRAGL